MGGLFRLGSIELLDHFPTVIFFTLKARGITLSIYKYIHRKPSLDSGTERCMLEGMYSGTLFALQVTDWKHWTSVVRLEKSTWSFE
ncbi:hypothetical protein CFP56_027845 [Quercus suber]|uniref:Uncharacterized protein n=1 Tax=Quercus suber TaxID=58331 RepID=A0AAW0LWN3_QUESU